MEKLLIEITREITRLLIFIIYYKKCDKYLINYNLCDKITTRKNDIKGVNMSLVKNKRFLIICLLAVVSLFLFGCETWVDVNNIAFDDEEIVLLVGEEYTPKISFTPTHPSNSGYKIISDNSSIVSVVGNKIKAMSDGFVKIRVQADDNNQKEDVMLVEVKATQTKLLSPTNLNYDSTNQVISFDNVKDAVGYTLKINGEEIDLGNSNSYYLKSEHYNDILTISVRANAATYTKAFLNSSFSGEIKIYQAGSVENAKVVGGNLFYDGVKNCVYDIKLDNTTIANNIIATNFNLKNVDTSFAGKYVKLGVVCKIDENFKMNNPTVKFCDSQTTNINVYCVDVAQIEMNNNIVSWNNVINANNYILNINGVEVETRTNTFNLEDYKNYNSLTTASNNYTLYVDVKLDKKSTNIIKTSATSNIVEFNRLASPVVRLDNNKFVWDSVNNASLYKYTLKYSDKIVSASTTQTYFDLSSYPADTNYEFEVYASSNKIGDVIYLQSLKSANNAAEIKRQDNAEIAIENYKLKINNAVIGDGYKILLNDTELQTILAVNEQETYDLNDNYQEGVNVISVVHLGDNTLTFDSDIISKSFTQLNNIATGVEIKNSIIKLQTNSELNANGKILISFDNGATKEEFSTYNLIDNPLIAGVHTVKFYIEGDGSSVFSVRDNGVIVDVASKDFTVLQSPSLTVADVEKSKLVFNAVDYAEGYEVYEGITKLDNQYEANSPFEIDLVTGAQSYYVKAIGDGENTINSVLSSELKVYKLTAPTLKFNSNTGVLNMEKVEYEVDFVDNYTLLHNDNVIDYNFIDVIDLVDSNTFKIKANILSNEIDGVYYLDSNYFTLNVDKISNDVTIYMQDKNLIIDATSHNQEYDLIVSINDTEYTSNNNKLTNNGTNLDYNYDEINKQYSIVLFDDCYNSMIDSLTNDFKVCVQFINKSTGDDNFANNVKTDDVLIKYETKLSLTRNNQNLTSVLETGKTYTDYTLLINEENVIYLTADHIQAGNIIIPINYIYENVSLVAGENYNVSVVSLNTLSSKENPTAPSVGNKLYFTKLEPTTITFNKSEAFDDNSVVLSFNKVAESIEKTYTFELYNKTEGVKTNIKTKLLQDGDTTGDNFTINLDDYDLTGTVYAIVKIGTTASVTGESVVEVFNAVDSNEVSFIKLNAVDVNTINVDGNNLNFEAVDNSVAYEIYKETATGYVKCNTTLIEDNSANLSDITGETKIKIKAISIVKDEQYFYTNSNLSEEIIVNKLSQPTVSTKELQGYFVISMDENLINVLQNDKVNISLLINVNDSSTDTIIDLKQFNEDGTHKDNSYIIKYGNKLVLDPEGVLVYGESLVKEKVAFTYDITTTEKLAVNYINSETVALEVYGLISAINLKKVSSIDQDDNEIIEQMVWQSCGKNVYNSTNLENGYTFIFKTPNKTYLSSDSALKYFEDGEYKSYPIILSATNVLFPVAYDSNKNGTIEDSEIFSDGEYEFNVRVVPKQVDNLNLLCSKYYPTYKLQILKTPKLTVKNGCVEWDSVNNAVAYRVNIYNSLGEYLEYKIVTSNQFDFDGYNYEGLYSVEVKALNCNTLTLPQTNIVSSKYSSKLMVNREQKVTSATLDNGYLIFSANSLFTKAEIKFVDSMDINNCETFVYVNEGYDEAVNNLGIDSWQNLVDTNVLTNVKTYLVKIDDSTILKLTENRTYYIEIKLIGNSSEDLAIINSKVFTTNPNDSDTPLIVTKPDDVTFTVTKGKLTFSANDYAQLNYNLNNVTNNNEFYSKTKLFKLTIKGTNTTEIYALDYNSFINTKDSSLSSEDYEIIDSLDLYAVVKYPYSVDGVTKYVYLNVYKNNTIDFNNDYIYYYPATETISDDEISFKSATAEKLDLTLTNGGTFVVDGVLLGGDVNSSNEACLTSNSISSDVLVRYGINNININDGVVYLKDQRYKIDEQVLDNPVYKLTISSTDSGNSNKTIMYLYYLTEADAREVVALRDGEAVADRIIYRQLSFDNSNIYFDFGKEIGKGNFVINIRTLAGNGNAENTSSAADYLLNSKLVDTTYPVRCLSDINLSVNDGVLEFERSYVSEGVGEYTYTNNYEVKLVNTSTNEKFVYEITDRSDGVYFDNTTNKFSYELPGKIVYGDKEFIIDETSEYTINIKPIYKGEGINIVNGKYSIDVQFVISLGLSRVAVENGVLTWSVKDIDNYDRAKIIVRYLDKNSLPVSITFTTTGARVGETSTFNYQFGDGYYTLDGIKTNVILDSNTGLVVDGKIYTDYTIEVRVISKSSTANTINSIGKIVNNVNRLSKVDSTTIKSNDGILVWQSVADSARYQITLSQGGITKYVFTSLDNTNSLDIANLLDDNGNKVAKGNYIVNIRALGSNKLNAINSNNSASFAMLDKTTGIAIQNNKFVWNKVDGAQAYKVIISYTFDGETTTLQDVVFTNEYDIIDEIKGTYTVTVQAVGYNEGYVFNGVISDVFEGQTARPNPVKSIEYDSDNYRFKITTDSDFTATDNIEISYNLNGVLTSSVINYNSENVDNVYYFELCEIGTYTNISVVINRELSISSLVVSYSGSVEYDIFNAGNGKDVSYEISNATQLLNIAHRPNANYILSGNINLAGIDFANRIQNNGAVICEEFSGTLDGNNNSIYAQANTSDISYSISVKNKNFALFNSVNSATIKNVTIGKQNVTIELSNSFDNYTQDVIKLNILANEMLDSALEDVIVKNTNINVTISNSSSVKTLYVAPFASVSNNSSLQGCTANTIVNITGALNTTAVEYIGGMIAKSIKTTISDSDSSTSSSTLEFVEGGGISNTYSYVGGVVAYDGDNVNSSNFKNISSTLTFDNVNILYAGGMAAYGNKTKIINCQTHGSISKQIKTNTNFGGIIGYGKNINIASCSSDIEIDVTTSSSVVTIYIGGVAGYLSGAIISNNTHSKYTNNYTNITGDTITIGLYGNEI